MASKKSLLFSVLLVCQFIFAQQDSIVSLTEVLISDAQLRQFSNTQQVLRLNDSVIEKNQPSLTSLLNYNSGIYFKEYGFGMVSSPSFRGTSAQQTAVVWNGININSQFNGQTDFNTISTRDFNDITVRAGGGSVLYGSSAIGGTVHLNTNLGFESTFKIHLDVRYGSFNTSGVNYKVEASSEKWSAQVSATRNSSDNDFDYPDGNRKNSNGQYHNISVSGNFGYKINASSLLRFYSQTVQGDRHFSLLTPTDTKTKYKDFASRNLLEYVYFGTLTSKVKVAFLDEQYQYFENLETETPEYGKAQSTIAKYDVSYSPLQNLVVNAIADFTHTTGTGSDVNSNKRQIGSAAVLVKHSLKKIQYELGIRKEVTNNYDSPILFSAGMDVRFSKLYTLKWNASRNFRIPTFNDLYWSDGGNPNLKPESSYQAEISNVITSGTFNFSLTGYAAKISDMIQWLPGTTASWHPKNINKVTTYGLESAMHWEKKIGSHNFALNGTYSYTISENDKTGYQLIYVPYHKATGSLAYSFRKFTANYQALFNGEVYTRSDNNSNHNVDAYTVSNIGVDYNFGKSNTYKFGFQMLNVFDEHYEAMVRRPFPGRNYNFYLIINI